MCDLRKCIFGGLSVRSAAVIEADGEAFGFDKCTDFLDETFGWSTVSGVVAVRGLARNEILLARMSRV